MPDLAFVIVVFSYYKDQCQLGLGPDVETADVPARVRSKVNKHPCFGKDLRVQRTILDWWLLPFSRPFRFSTTSKSSTLPLEGKRSTIVLPSFDDGTNFLWFRLHCLLVAVRKEKE